MSRIGMIRLLNFSLTVHSPQALGERPSYLGKSPCGDKSLTSGLGNRSPSKCSSTEPHSPSSGGLMPCRNDKQGFGRALISRGDNAVAYATQVQAAFGASLPDGMNRIAA